MQADTPPLDILSRLLEAATRAGTVCLGGPCASRGATRSASAGPVGSGSRIPARS